MQNKASDTFEQIKRVNQYHQEYWSARELSKILEYADYRNFEKVLNKAKESCKNADQSIKDHFVEVTEMIELAQTAKQAGVKNYGMFTNYGYMGLYGGLKSRELTKKKRLKKNQKLLDHMGSEELAANLFRATQVDAKLKRENIQGEAKANQTHFAVGKKVRKTIKELGGTMPEKLPASENISKAKKRLKQVPKKLV